MIQRILRSRGFVSALLAMGTGAFLYYTHPFLADQIFLRVIAMRAPHAFLSFQYLYNTMLFTTPFMVFSTVLSGLYIFTLKVRRRISPGRLPRYSDPRKRDNLYLVVGEVHNRRKPGPSATPRWLTHKVAYDYVTLFDVYQCAISPTILEARIHEAEEIVMGRHYIAIKPEVYGQRTADLAGLGFVHDPKEDRYLAPATPQLRETLQNRGIGCESKSVLDPAQADQEKLAQLEAVKRWFNDDWKRIEPKLRTSIVEGISVFLSLFDDNPRVKKVFCPKKECYDPAKNVRNQYGKPLPSFSWLIENGKVCALNFPIGMNPGLAKALGVMMKLDFERAVLNRVPEIEAHPERHFRQVLFLCDEYQHFATVGENDPTGDEKFFSLSRQPKCIPIIATQSVSSLKSALPGDSWRTLLQTFRTKIFLALSDDFSARTASELCGREDKLKVSYNLSESGHDARVSLLTGKAVSQKANITASKSYNTQSDYRFDMKTFMELRNAQSVIIAYDGLNPMPPMFCYLKPYFNDPNKSYFKQLAEGGL